ncbi:type VI secretion system protein ImpL, partial [Pseudomonas sp. JUb42]|nr:type VI secretion system protein ImpL [Pseudomonas sp. JUb42]
MTQELETEKTPLWQTTLLLALITALLVAGGGVIWWGWEGAPPIDQARVRDLQFKALLCWMVLFVVALVVWQLLQDSIGKLMRVGRQPLPSLPKPAAIEPNQGAKARAYLREHYGPLWRYKVRLLLVVGEPDHVEAIAPGLTDKHWLEGQHAVLLWGGRPQDELKVTFAEQWQGLSRWRALDGVIWALDKDRSSGTAAMSQGVRRLQDLARSLHWQLPIHLWQVCASLSPQTGRDTQPVGVSLAARFTAQHLEDSLTQLVEPLRQLGWKQMKVKITHDFLTRLSRDLHVEGIARWRKALTPLLGEFAYGLPLRGLWFSLPLPAAQAQDLQSNHWCADATWQGVLSERGGKGRRLGWPATRMLYALFMASALVSSIGLLLSFNGNRALILQEQNTLIALQQAQTPHEQILALHNLAHEVARLDYRAQHGTPWHLRFGLSKNDIL